MEKKEHQGFSFCSKQEPTQASPGKMGTAVLARKPLLFSLLLFFSFSVTVNIQCYFILASWLELGSYIFWKRKDRLRPQAGSSNHHEWSKTVLIPYHSLSSIKALLTVYNQMPFHVNIDKTFHCNLKNSVCSICGSQNTVPSVSIDAEAGVGQLVCLWSSCLLHMNNFNGKMLNAIFKKASWM